MDPLVTFVVPCYKHAHFLHECVSSILAQTYSDFEILIMDNCSPDNTPEVARSFRDPRVRYVRNETNIGHVRNFNKGVDMSRGKYVWLLSADDFLRSPQVLRRSVEVMERNPEVGYVFCRACEVRGTREAGLAWWSDCGNRDRIWRGTAFLNRLLRFDCVVMSSALVRKESFLSAGSLSPDLPQANDWYLWCLIALRNRVAYVAEAMVSCRIHEQSLTSLHNRQSTPIGVLDELNVLWRIARSAETQGVTVRRACNASIAGRAARALRDGPVRGTRRGLTEPEFEEMVRANASDAEDTEDIWARVYRVLGDEQYWDGEMDAAMRSYGMALGLRPWSPKVWVKYILLSTGKLGTHVRRLYASSAAIAGLKVHPRPPARAQNEP